MVRAARGMGMTGPQMLRQVELPLALPLVLTGVRIAAVQLVATATLAALVGGGGLGRIITAGFNLASTPQVVAGAVLVAVFALLVEGLFEAASGSLPPGTAGGRRREADVRRAARLLPALLLAAACTTGPSLESQGDVTAPPGDSKHLTIGSAGFTESDLLAQMYALLLDQAGYRTDILSVTNREIYEPALESGQIDVVPEYAATFADWLNAKARAPSRAGRLPRPGATMAALRQLAAPRGLTVLEPGRAVDQNAFAVLRAYAAKHQLKTLSDLGGPGCPSVWRRGTNACSARTALRA